MKKIFTFLAAAAMAGTMTVQAETANVEVTIWEGNTARISTFESEISKDAEGHLVASNFINSGYDLVFSFTEPTETGNDGVQYGFTFYSNGEDESYEYEGTTYHYFYPMIGEDDIVCTITANRKDYTFYDMSIEPAGCYVKKSSTGSWKFSGSNKQFTGEYLVYFAADGYLTAGSEDSYVYVDVDMIFDMPAEGAGVAEINAADNNAPVEYYNLNGIRVENPSNGLFIRKQGGNVSKVIVK